ncbi:MAG: META domain-containing protein [Geodermatophilaceae bacterium]|nr:META domain-containing protein [Geodermatophilaceae bacterium]
MTVGGLTTQVPPSIDAVLRFDGAGSYSARACNYMGGSAEIDDDSLVLGLGSMTEMGCMDLRADIDAVLGAVTGESVRWAIAGEELTLAAPGGTTLTYRVRETIYPDAAAQEVLSGERAGYQYRLAVENSDGNLGLNVHYRAAPGRPWGRQRIGAPYSGGRALDPLIEAPIAEEFLIGGFVTADTVRVTHRAGEGAPAVDVALHPSGDPSWKVAAGFVAEHSAGSRIVGYDVAGEVTAEWG